MNIAPNLIVENDFAYFIVENYERSCRNVKEVLKGVSENTFELPCIFFNFISCIFKS